MLRSSKYLRISLGKCAHILEPIDKVGSVNLDDRITDHFIQEHGDHGSDFRAWSMYQNKDFTLDKYATIRELCTVMQMDNVSYQCAQPVPVPEPEIVEVSDEVEEMSDQKNSFKIIIQTAKKASKKNVDVLLRNQQTTIGRKSFIMTC